MKTPSILASAGLLLVLVACDSPHVSVEETIELPTGLDSEIGTEADYDRDTPAYFTNLIGDHVYFAVDKSVISEEAGAILDEQARWLMENDDFMGNVEGHADERGTREYNLALGARRASAVRDRLVSSGIADNRLQIVTYGKERPAATCSSEECWSQNRRSVTRVYLRSDD